MNKFLNFALLMLVVIAFFLGINLGKRIQAIDTPVKTVIKQVTITVIPTNKPSLSPSASGSATKTN
jgi:hypothetical protein